ncbi:MAG TPA: hypothetical protein VMW17_23105 [Candidatus Binatia bacterium]|nr:hypothetical protein [Candidatus Binatia bacterium]
MIPKLAGKAAMEYVKAVAAAVRRIHIIQHIVEGDHVATLLEEETIYGVLLPILSKFQLESGRIKDVRVFYDPRPLTAAE